MLLRELLERAGYSVDEAADGKTGLRQLYANAPALVILDVSMPDMDGYQALERIRDLSDVPVLMLTARTQELEKVRGLSAGADDYVAKPFGMSELVARVEAVLRRSRITPQVGRAEKLTMPGLEIDPDLHRVLVDGADAGLTPLEFRLLQALTADSGRVLTRDQLRRRVWGVPQRKRDRSVDVCVRKLRSKIDLRSRTHVYIHTHPGVGYRFDPVPR
jgi:DNA-binding response OmpR family regulator